jgi:menaquinone reductase, molybdopterin-binding-like subunit
MKRREFIKLTSAGAASATLLSACGHPENRLIPVLVADGEYIPGLDYWKATACGLCEAGCGIVVRTRENKANKIEGNPHHPVNRGALCARGQAGLQSLYNPDRIRSPLKRTGERGAGEFQEISWDEAIKTLADRLREIKAEGRAASVVFMSGGALGVASLAAELFMSAYGSRQIVSAGPLRELWSWSSYYESYDKVALPFFDIANATYLLSFGARFLEAWHSPVMYSLAYGEFRRAGGKARGHFVHVEPRMSLTAANADEWLPAAPGAEGIIALAIAQVIIREGLIKDAAPPQFINQPLESFAPENIAAQADVSAEKIIRIAREFAASERPLAIGGGAAASVGRGQDSMAAINFLNRLVGNLNKPGGVLLYSGNYFNPLESMRTISSHKYISPAQETVVSETTSALLIHEANPAYTTPRMAEKIKAVPFVASFASFMDETARLADLILPDHTPLERWDITPSYSGQAAAVVTLAQPVVKPEANTRQTADVLIALARAMGIEAAAFAFQSAEEMVKRAAAELEKLNGPTDAEDSNKTFWDTFAERGVWTGPSPIKSKTGESEEHWIGFPPRSFPGYKETSGASEQEYPFVLLAYEHPAFGFGEQANLPLLQELPDPMTTVMWGSWVEINPKTAASLGIEDGDLIEVTTPHGAARAPVVIYPAIRPDVIAIPFGQGHSAHGRYASARGANAASLDPWIASPDVAPVTVRARISKVGSKAKLVRFGADGWQRAHSKR